MRVTTNGAIGIVSVSMMAVMVAAIAYQEFSWWVIPFAVLFLTIFAVILFLCLMDRTEFRFRSASKTEFPNKPWMRDKRWRSDEMTSRSRSEFWGSVALMLILGMFALVGSVSLRSGVAEGNYWVLLNIVPIAAAVYWARKTSLAWKVWRLERFVTLTSETRPAWIGAQFSVMMEIAQGLSAEGVEVWLEHLKTVRVEESDGVSYEKVTDLKLSGQAEALDSGQIRLRVDIPQNSPAASWDDAQGSWWDFVVAVGLPAGKITLRYEIPVADPAAHLHFKA
ncbi:MULTISPECIES: hypothetical protein [unclassified Ruegeria]|uniref:hypothetical protein n=1 Tax=unclassified Ruegeria TaxID=2625375 RepID=UPI001489EA7E|nr:MULTISPECIES: hypothetical protein [unclassified Ruegeria]